MVQFIFHIGSFTDGISNLEGRERHKAYFINVFKTVDKETISWLMAIAAGALWMKVLQVFRLTRFLGPLIKMIQKMIREVMVFMVLYIAQLVFFACVGNILFTENPRFNNLWDSGLALFDASLANYYFSDVQGSEKGNLVGELYYIVFIVMNNILIINLLIAILSSTYARLEDQQLVLYINEILLLRPTLEYDRNYSGLIATFAPWNVFAVIGSPLFISVK